jgi:micrococcal nuclease
MKRQVNFLLVLIFSLLIFSCSSKSGNRINPDGFLSVSKVVDGDTFWADDGSEKGVKIRLIGVDAPESRRTGKKEIGYFGKEAKEFLTKRLSGELVKLICDVDSLDRYGRTLAYVYLKDGTFLNAELVKQGYAMVMTVPPNVRFAEEFVKLQQEARVNNRGLWKE